MTHLPAPTTRDVAVLIATSHVMRRGVPEPEARERGDLLIAIDEACERLGRRKPSRDLVLALAAPALRALLLATCGMYEQAA